MDSSEPYRIISLDGGGPWALIQAYALRDIFNDSSGHEILEYFDLAIANSGGSITLAGLVKNLRPSQILEFFCNRKYRGQIFVKRNPVAYWFAQTFRTGPKWNTASKMQGLRNILNSDVPLPGLSIALGDLALTALPGGRKNTQIIITAYDYDLNREVFFRRRLSTLDALPNDPFIPTLAGAVHASTNAPINYFDAPASVANTLPHALPPRRFWDGGVGGYNNPILRGVIEALGSDAPGNVLAKNIQALSIGSGTTWQPAGSSANPDEQPLFVKETKACLVRDIPKMATAILDDPPDSATLNAHVISGAPREAPRIIRMNPVIGPKWQDPLWILPDGFRKFRGLTSIEAFSALNNIPMDAVEQDQVDKIRILAEEWIADRICNQPILRNQSNGISIIGHDCYSKARTAWAGLLTLQNSVPARADLSVQSDQS